MKQTLWQKVICIIKQHLKSEVSFGGGWEGSFRSLTVTSNLLLSHTHPFLYIQTHTSATSHCRKTPQTETLPGYTWCFWLEKVCVWL